MLSAALASCDGSAPGENAIIPDNNLPVFISASVISVVENTTAAVTVQVTDADNDSIVYSITGGADQAAFSINSVTGELAFLAAPDYETPAAAGGGNSYVLIVSADDDLSVVEQNILISVANADDNLPVASNLIVLDNNAGALVEGDTLVSNYVYSDADGDAEGATTLRWLRNGVAISGQTGTNYVVTATDVGEPVSFEITPVSANGTAGTAVSSPTITTTNNAPVASSVVITGDTNGIAKLGDTLTGAYTYTDFENDGEGPTAFRWLRDGIPIASVTQPSYTLVSADVDHVIRFEVTPFSNSGTSPGAVVLSAAVTVPNNPPTAAPVTVSGNPYSGQILSGSYAFFDVENDKDLGASTFRWLRDDVEIFGETSSTYLLKLVDVGKTIKFEVTPQSLTGASPGIVVESAGLKILNQAPTVASSSIRFLNNLSSPTLLASHGDTLTGDYVFADLENDLERASGSIYQWYRGGIAISGATDKTYTLGDNDLKDSLLTFEVTPIARSGTIEGLPSVSTIFVTVVNEVPVVSNVAVSGDAGGYAGDGFVLTGSYDYADLESNPDTSTFRWLRADNSAIATTQNYTVQAAELGEIIRLEVTPASSVGSSPGLAVLSTSITLNAVPVASPTISGASSGVNAIVGDVLTGVDGYADTESDPQGASIYSWLRVVGADITVISSGTTNSPYTVTSADSGAVIRFEVLPKASGGTSPGIVATSADLNVINVVPVASPPTITGVLTVGEVLTGNYSYSDFDGDAQGLSAFRWLRDGAPIAGETAITYTLVEADSGTTITFEVTPVALSGLSPGATVVSSGVSINELPVANTVAISGTATVGQTLSGSYSFSDAEDVQGTSTFRWLRNGVAISGETTTNYTVALEDVGELIQFEVTPVSTAGSSPGFAVASTGVTPTNIFASNVVCTTNENGIANKLGVNRYWRFTATQTQAITITASQTSGTISASTSNPDLYLYRQGTVVAQETADTSTSQTMVTGVTAGDDYVLELKEVHYATNAAPVSTACYDVSIAYSGGYAKPGDVVEKTAAGSTVAKSGPSSCSAASEINVSGTVTYERVPHNAGTSGLDYASIASSPIKGAVVEVICGAEGYVYDSGITDATGAYSLKASNGVDNYVRVKAQLLDVVAPGTWNFKVVDNTSGGALYVMDTTPFNSAIDVAANDFTAGSGWGGAAYTGPRVAAPFAILDSVYDAFQEILTVDANAVFPALNINWSTLNAALVGDKTIGEITTSHYDPATGEVYVLGDEDSDTDEYDKHVIIHEWAHYFEDNLSRTDSIGGAHNIGEILDMRLAFGEGFGNAYSGIASGDPVYRDSSGVGQATGFDFNMDTDVCVNPGWYSECSVHELLYDFKVTTFVDDFTPLYNVLVNEQKNTSAFTSIFSFVWELKVNNAAEAAAIDTLVTGHNIDVITDIYGDSEATNNPGGTDQLPIYEQF